MTDLIRGESPFFRWRGGKVRLRLRRGTLRAHAYRGAKVGESGTAGKILGRRKDIGLEYNNYTGVKYKGACTKSQKTR